MSGAATAGRRVRLTVHPGLGKTATTTVQSVLRERAPAGLWYGGIRSHSYDHPFATAFEALLREPLDRHTWRARAGTRRAVP
jgi:hypothetical protein